MEPSIRLACCTCLLAEWCTISQLGGSVLKLDVPIVFCVAGRSAPPEVKPEIPFRVVRSRYGNLPVYVDYKSGGSRVLTIIRKIEGDATVRAGFCGVSKLMGLALFLGLPRAWEQGYLDYG